MRLYVHILIVVLIAAFNSMVSSADSIVIDGSTGVKPLVEALAKQYQILHGAPVIEIGSGLEPQARIHALSNGQISIAMASHGVNRQRISQLGLAVHHFASVAVVMGVNETVKIETISHQQLCDIYAGHIDNWHSLGGPMLAVLPFIRPYSEVDTEVIAAHIPCFAGLQLAQHVQLKQKSGQMASSLAQTNGAIGMTTLVRVAQSKGKIRSLAINGVEPTSAMYLRGDYVLGRELYLITATEPPNSVSQFLTFIFGKQGADIIRSNHAIPIK